LNALNNIDKYSFIVVDDMESMRGVIVSILRDLGVEQVHQAKDGYEAWKLLTSKNVDIVISDWDMPKTNGLELLKKIRGSIEHKGKPFLLLTAATEREQVKQAVSAGVDQYLAKPFKPKDLEYRVIKLLGKLDRAAN